MSKPEKGHAREGRGREGRDTFWVKQEALTEVGPLVFKGGTSTILEVHRNYMSFKNDCPFHGFKHALITPSFHDLAHIPSIILYMNPLPFPHPRNKQSLNRLR